MPTFEEVLGGAQPIPCSRDAVGSVEGPDGWRRCYCAEHWPAYREAAEVHGLTVIDTGARHAR